MEGIYKLGELVPQDFPFVEVWRNGGVLGFTGCAEGSFPGVSYLNVELAAVTGVSLPREQACLFQSGQDAAQGLALNVDQCGELFLVYGTWCQGFEGDNCGPRQAKWCERVVKTALNQAGGCGEKHVAVPDVGRGVEGHRVTAFLQLNKNQTRRAGRRLALAAPLACPDQLPARDAAVGFFGDQSFSVEADAFARDRFLLGLGVRDENVASLSAGPFQRDKGFQSAEQFGLGRDPRGMAVAIVRVNLADGPDLVPVSGKNGSTALEEVIDTFPGEHDVSLDL